MHCKACDKTLSEKEIDWNNDLQDWELCTTCYDVAMDAAFGRANEDDEFVLLDTDYDEDESYLPSYLCPTSRMDYEAD